MLLNTVNTFCLSTDITTLRVSPSIGESFTYSCEYPNGTQIKKFICKGEDPSVCTPLVSTTPTNRDNGKFSLKENTLRTTLTTTVRKVTTEDTGTYWCGAESGRRNQSDPFFHRLVMTVFFCLNVFCCLVRYCILLSHELRTSVLLQDILPAYKNVTITADFRSAGIPSLIDFC